MSSSNAKPPIPPAPPPPDFPLTGRPAPLVGTEFPLRVCHPRPGTTRTGKPRRACDTQSMVVVAKATPSAARPAQPQVLAVQKGLRYLVSDAEIRREQRTSATHRAAREAPYTPPPPRPTRARPPHAAKAPPAPAPALASPYAVVVRPSPGAITLTFDTRALDAMDQGPWFNERRRLLRAAPVTLGTVFGELPVVLDVAGLDALLPPFFSAVDAYGTALQRGDALLRSVSHAVEEAIRRGQPPTVPIPFSLRMPGQTHGEAPYVFEVLPELGADPARGPVALRLSSTTAARSCERYEEDWRRGHIVPEPALLKCNLSDAQIGASDAPVSESELPSFPNPGRRSAGRRVATYANPPRGGFPRRVPPVPATYANPLVVRTAGEGLGRYAGLPNPPPGLPRQYVTNPGWGVVLANPPKNIAPGQSYWSPRPDPLLGARVVGDDFVGEVRARALGCKGEPAHVVGGVLVPAARVQAALRRKDAPPRAKRAASAPVPPPPPTAPAAPAWPPIPVGRDGFPPALLRVTFTAGEGWWRKDTDRMQAAILPEGVRFDLPWETVADRYGLHPTMGLGPSFEGPRGPLLLTPDLAQSIVTTGASIDVPVKVEDVTATYAFIATLAPPSFDMGGTFTLLTFQREGDDNVLRVAAVPREIYGMQTARYASGLYGDREVTFDEVRARAEGRYVDPEDLPPVVLHPSPTASRLYSLRSVEEVWKIPENVTNAVTPAGHAVPLPWQGRAGHAVFPPFFFVPRDRVNELGDVVFFPHAFLEALRAQAAAHKIAMEIQDVTDQWVPIATTAPTEYDGFSTVPIRAANTGYLPPELRYALDADPRYATTHSFRVVLTHPKDVTWQTTRYASGNKGAWIVPLADALTWTAPPPPAPVTAPLPIRGAAVAADPNMLLARFDEAHRAALAEFPDDAPDFGGAPVARASAILQGVSYGGVAALLRAERYLDAEAAVRGVEQRLDAARAQVPLDVAGAFQAPEGAFGAMFGGPAVPPPPSVDPDERKLDELVKIVSRWREKAYGAKHLLERDTKARQSKIPKTRSNWQSRHEAALQWIGGTEVAQGLLDDRSIPLREKEERIKRLFLDLERIAPLKV